MTIFSLTEVWFDHRISSTHHHKQTHQAKIETINNTDKQMACKENNDVEDINNHAINNDIMTKLKRECNLKYKIILS